MLCVHDDRNTGETHGRTSNIVTFRIMDCYIHGHIISVERSQSANISPGNTAARKLFDVAANYTYDLYHYYNVILAEIILSR